MSESPGDSDLVYLDQVMAEIDEEVRRRRASGDIPAGVERELDSLFLAYSPMAGWNGTLEEALRVVDSATFIDPLVPVASDKSGGALVKKIIRQLALFYVGFLTHQVNQFTSAVSRSLHVIENQMSNLAEQLEGQQVPAAEIIETRWAHDPGAWWNKSALDFLSQISGRVLHCACGNGWLVGRLSESGIDVYGVDPRPRPPGTAPTDDLDLREEPLLAHLRAIAPGALGGLILTGVVDGMTAGERTQLLGLVADRLAPDGRLVIHSLSLQGWASQDLPPQADLASGRPLRPGTWEFVLGNLGFSTTVEVSTKSVDYLVLANRPALVLNR